MIQVYPVNLNEVNIQWSNLEGEKFNVSKSTSPEGPFEIILNQTEKLICRDRVDLFQVGLRFYYKVEGFVGGIKVSEYQGATAEYNQRDGIANKVIYENQLALRVMRNPPVFVLLKQRNGRKCPDCWNPITEKQRFSNCKSCNGTGNIFGYHKPIKTLISRDFSQLIDYSNMLDGDKVNQTSVSAWITNEPLLTPGDIVVDVMNQRFNVVSVMPRTRSQYIIRQVVNLVPLEKGHPAYLTEVDLSELR